MCLPLQYREIGPIGNEQFIKSGRYAANVTSFLFFTTRFNKAEEEREKTPIVHMMKTNIRVINWSKTNCSELF